MLTWACLPHYSVATSLATSPHSHARTQGHAYIAYIRVIVLLVHVLLLLAATAMAQDGTIYPLETPDEPNAILLGTGGVEDQPADGGAVGSRTERPRRRRGTQ